MAEGRPEKAHVLHLFSGRRFRGNLRSTIKEFAALNYKHFPRGVDVHVAEVDYLNCNCWDDKLKRPAAEVCADTPNERCCNLMRDHVYNGLLRECKTGKYTCVVAGIPCNGYSCLRFLDDGGARALRDREHPTGLPGLSEQDRASLAMSNTLTVRSLALCAAVFEAGGEVLIENPMDYGEPGLWATNPRTGRVEADSAVAAARLQKRHAPLWCMPWTRSFAEATDAELLNFAQCRFESPFQKYTSLLVTRDFERCAPSLSAFRDKPCTCRKPHAKVAVGRNANGDWVSAASARYPEAMNEQIARAVRELVHARLRTRADDATKAWRTERMRSFWRILGSAEAQAACSKTLAGTWQREKPDGAQRSFVQPTLHTMMGAATTAAPAAATRVSAPAAREASTNKPIAAAPAVAAPLVAAPAAAPSAAREAMLSLSLIHI